MRLPVLALAVCFLGPALAAPVRAEGAPAWARGESAPDDLRISLLTFGPGDDVASWFGHSALLIEDTRRGEDRVYNYGMFSFDGTLLVRYALGRLSFWVGTSSLERTLSLYREQNRDISTQVLKLTPVQRVMFAMFLERNVLPANRNYLYHHFNDNCSTRPRDAIDSIVNGALKRLGTQPARMSLRDHVRRHASLPLGPLLDFAMNDEIERPITRWDEAFLPAELAAQVQDAGLVESTTVLHTAVDRAKTPAHGASFTLPLLRVGILTASLVLGLAALSRSRARARRALGVLQLVVGLLIGGPGALLALMWLITEHTVTYGNENLLLTNPLTLLAVPLGAWLALTPDDARPVRALRALWLVLASATLLACVGKLLPAFDQDNAPFLALLVPINLGCAAAFVWLAASRGGARAPQVGDFIAARSSIEKMDASS